MNKHTNQRKFLQISQAFIFFSKQRNSETSSVKVSWVLRAQSRHAHTAFLQNAWKWTWLDKCFDQRGTPESLFNKLYVFTFLSFVTGPRAAETSAVVHRKCSGADCQQVQTASQKYIIIVWKIITQSFKLTFYSSSRSVQIIVVLIVQLLVMNLSLFG